MKSSGIWDKPIASILFITLWIVVGILCLSNWVITRCTPDTEKLLREQDINGLIEALDHRDNVVRGNAANALGELGDERAIEPLIATLKDDDPFVSDSAALALGNLGGTQAVEPLINALEKDNTGAAIALGRIGDARAVVPLLEVMVDEPEYSALGDNAAYALRVIVDAKGPGVMAEALENENPAVRRMAARLMREFDARFVGGAQDPMLGALLALLGDQEPGTREDAAWLLGSMGDEQAIESLVIALTDEENGVRNTAAWALGRIGDPKAVEPLLEAACQTSSSARAAAHDALVTIGDDAIDPLIIALDKPNTLMAQEAALALGDLGDPRAVEPLVNCYYKARQAEEWDRHNTCLTGIRGASKDDTSHLTTYLNNRQTALDHYMMIIRVGNENTVPALIEALERYGDLEMATVYLNSGREELESAAQAWAAANGYIVRIGGIGSGLGWGD